jgi:pimeloyl-ACP methyl ester carboxylesterase
VFKEDSLLLSESGLRIAYRDYGAKEPGESVLLLLHGWQDNCASFYNLAPLLSIHYRVLALDFPGHGHSDWLGAGGQYHFVDWLVPLRQFLAELDVAEVILVGHSMGAGVAMLFAACFPQQTLALGMIEAFSPLPHSFEELPRRVNQQFESRQILAAKGPKFYKTLEEAVKVRLSVGLDVESAATEITKRGTILGPEGWKWRNDPRIKLTSLLGFTVPHIQHCLSLLKCPRILILGEKGADIIAQTEQLFRPQLAGMQTHFIAGGHHCHMEHPEHACQLLLDCFGSSAS